MLETAHIVSGPTGFAEKPLPALHAERFAPGLAPRSWIIRQSVARRSHLLVIETRRGTATMRGTTVAIQFPGLLWLPGDHEGIPDQFRDNFWRQIARITIQLVALQMPKFLHLSRQDEAWPLHRWNVCPYGLGAVQLFCSRLPRLSASLPRSSEH